MACWPSVETPPLQPRGVGSTNEGDLSRGPTTIAMVGVLATEPIEDLIDRTPVALKGVARLIELGLAGGSSPGSRAVSQQYRATSAGEAAAQIQPSMSRLQVGGRHGLVQQESAAAKVHTAASIASLDCRSASGTSPQSSRPSRPTRLRPHPGRRGNASRGRISLDRPPRLGLLGSPRQGDGATVCSRICWSRPRAATQVRAIRLARPRGELAQALLDGDVGHPPEEWLAVASTESPAGGTQGRRQARRANPVVRPSR